MICKLAERERLLGQGKDLEEVCRHLETTESTWNLWHSQYGGLKSEDAQAP